MAHPVEVLIRTYAAPVMKAAGFTRAGRYFRRQSERGDWALLWISPSGSLGDEFTRFGGRPALGPAGMVAFWRQGAPADAETTPPPLSHTLQLSTLMPPDRFRDRPWDESDWRLDPRSELEECGARLAEVLTEQTVPLLERLLVREALVAEIRAGTPLGPSLTPYNQLTNEILASVDWAPVEEVERLLAQVPDEGPFNPGLRRWVRAYLDARAASEGVSGGT